MQTKTQLTISLTGGDVKVKKGDVFKIGDILVDETPEEIDEFDVAKLLGVKAPEVLRLLTVVEGESVEKSHIIAKKKNLFHKTLLRAPVSGTFMIIDEAKGIVGLKRGAAHKKITASYPGVVVQVKDDGIVVEIKGVVISATSGKGHQTIGQLTLFPESVDMLSMPVDIAGKIIAVKNAVSDLIAKADTLGVRALIVEKVDQPEFMLPYVVIPDFSTISRYNEKQVLVHGDNKLLLVL